MSDIRENLRLGYVILSHRDWRQVARLYNTLITLDPTSVIVVSHDQRDPEGVSALARMAGPILQTDPGGRADFTGVSRWLRAANELSRHDVDYVILISGQDYIIKHPDLIKSELAGSGDGYFEYFDVDDPSVCPWRETEGTTRYRFSWHEVVDLQPRWARRLHLLHGFNRLQPGTRINVAYGKLRLGLRNEGPPASRYPVIYGGSQWNALSRRAVDRVLDVARTDIEFMAWARRTLVSDESFFQTILMNQEDLQFSQGSKRYYDFVGTHFGHPRELREDDTAPILSSDRWFARKFHWASSGIVLDAVDEALGIARGGTEREPGK